MARASWTSCQAAAELSHVQHSPAAAAGSRNHTAVCRTTTHHWAPPQQAAHHTLGTQHSSVPTALRTQQHTSIQSHISLDQNRQPMALCRQRLAVPHLRSQKPLGPLGPLGGVQISGKRSISGYVQSPLQGRRQCTKQRHRCASAEDSSLATSSIVRAAHSVPCPFHEPPSLLRASQCPRHTLASSWPNKKVSLHSTSSRPKPSHPRATSSASSAGTGTP